MLKIRLAQAGRHKRPFFRIVLTEHTKPIKSGYKEIVGWYDPIKHLIQVDVDKIKDYIAKGAQPSARVAKLLHQETNDKYWTAYYTEIQRTRKPKKEPEEEPVKEEPKQEKAPAQEAPAEQTEDPATEETSNEETTAEQPEQEAEQAETTAAEEEKKK